MLPDFRSSAQSRIESACTRTETARVPEKNEPCAERWLARS